MALDKARSSNITWISDVASRSEAYRTSSTRIDGADDMDGGVSPQQRGLRSLAKLGRDGVRSVWMKATPRSFHSPLQIANEIRRLRGHEKSTFYQRHMRFNNEDESSAKLDDLVPLCMDLVTYPRRDLSRDDWESAIDITTELSLQDPDIFFLVQKCRHEAQSLPQPSGLGYALPYSEEDQNTYRRWSNFISSPPSRAFGDDPETMRFNCDALKDSFSLEYSAQPYLAARFLPYALSLKLKGNNLQLLRQLWDHFLQIVSERIDNPFWIENMDLCFKNILLSGKSLVDFATRDQLARIAPYLNKHATRVPFIFATLFPVPEIDFRKSKFSPYGAVYKYPAPTSDWDLSVASSYALSFQESIQRSRPTGNNLVANYAQDMHFDGPLFAASNWMMLYRIINNAMLSYNNALGINHRGMTKSVVERDLIALVGSALRGMASSLHGDNVKGELDPTSAILFMAQSVDIDRYHKREALFHFLGAATSTIAGGSLVDRYRIQRYMCTPKSVHYTVYIPQFRNVSYIRRFRRGKEYFISADSVPDSMIQARRMWGRGGNLEDIAVDTMLLSGFPLTCLHVDGDTRSESFDCTGHYPILAWTDLGTGEPLYVAFVRVQVDAPWYFTTVKDGASSVNYTDEVGEEHVSRDFFVLVLRYDPSDTLPQISNLRMGAMDPTGPVYWSKFWPQMDAYYSRFSRHTSRDDWHLENFINKTREQETREHLFDGFD